MSAIDTAGKVHAPAATGVQAPVTDDHCDVGAQLVGEASDDCLALCAASAAALEAPYDMHLMAHLCRACSMHTVTA